MVNVFFFSKIQNYNIYIFYEKYCQYIIKKYYINCIKKNGKYIDYENLSPKYINNGKYFDFINKYFTNLLS